MNKKTIAVIGCSFSLHRHKYDTKVWPQLLAERVSPQIIVKNFSMFCNSVSNQCLQALEIVKSKPDLIIIQWTTDGRVTFIEDANKYKHFLSSKKYMREYSKGYYEYDRNYLVTKEQKAKGNFDNYCIHFNPADLELYKNKFIDTYQTMLLHGVGPLGEFSDRYSYLLKSSIAHECKENEIGLIMFDFLDRYRNCQTQHLDFVAEREIVDFPKKVVDTGFHLGQDGHKELSKIMYPKVNKFI